MKKILSCAALSVVLLAGCSLNHSGIIKVNDTVITKAQFDNAIDKEIANSPFASFGGVKNFSKSNDNMMYLIYKDKVVNSLIVKALLDEEIKKRNIIATEEDVQNEMKSIIDKVGSKEELNKLLKTRGIPNNEFMDDLKTQIKMKKLINSTSKITISDSDAQKYYNQNLKEFKHGEQVRASHILLSADTLKLIQDMKAKNKNITPSEINANIEKIEAEQKAKAEAILKEVKANPEKFEEIATKNSDDKASAARGGELGFFTKDMMVPEFSKAAFAMKPNTVSENVIKTPYGYHIIKVTDRIEAGTTPFVKVKDEIKFYLETQEQLKVLKNFMDGARKTAKIEYLDESFSPEATKAQAENAQKKIKEYNKTSNNNK